MKALPHPNLLRQRAAVSFSRWIFAIKVGREGDGGIQSTFRSLFECSNRTPLKAKSASASVGIPASQSPLRETTSRLPFSRLVASIIRSLDDTPPLPHGIHFYRFDKHNSRTQVSHIIIVLPIRPQMKSARFKNKADADKALHLIRLVVQLIRV